MRTITGKIYIHPIPASRPRVVKKRAYTEPKYSTYKIALTYLLKNERIPKQDYESIKVVFAIPYSKGIAKKRKIQGKAHRQKPDIDNFIKGFMDALEQSGIIQNDSQICNVHAFKLFDCQQGYIEFELK
ncbi:MAG: RusA family crossover junction endodeoxyribonuclease [Ignavibacteriaceae bacterium]